MNVDLLDINALISSGVGALIGSSLTLLGVYWTHLLQKKEAKQKDTEHIDGLLQAFQAEIETLWGVYKASAGAKLEGLSNDEALLEYWPLTQDYLTIYNTHASSIGKIKNHELRKQIITTYTKIRSMIDSFRMNNEILREWEYHRSLFRETLNPIHESNANAHLESLVEYAKSLKKTHSELKSMVSELLHNLRRNPRGLPSSE